MSVPEALLFTAPGCPHCPAVQRALETLLQSGEIASLTVRDVSTHAQEAAALGVRAAPWLRLGPFTLTGAHSLGELRQWAAWAQGESGLAHYLSHLLQQGEFPQAVAFVAADTQRLAAVLEILADSSVGIDVRLGSSALLERYARQPALQQLVPNLSALTQHEDHRVRADAVHLLGLSGSAAAREAVTRLLDDAHDEVREIAREALHELADAA